MKTIKLGNKELKLPIIQGGMGVGISLGNLAGAVMKQGGMGVISAAHTGYRDPNFKADPFGTSFAAIKEEATLARKISCGAGLLAVNVMVAGNKYTEYIKSCVDAKVDAIISGAGLPLELPKLVEGSDVLIAPIVSSGRAASLICKVWIKRYNRIPDFIVVEGSEAGGHLGFKKDELLSHTTQALKDIVKDVKTAIEPYINEYKKHIPVFAAGGIFTGTDIANIIEEGADGVQMGTRFIGTHECDASDAYKQYFIDAKKEDIVIVQSPAGMPGRAFENKLMKRVHDQEKIKINFCFNCLVPCKPAETPYCITQALMEAVKGNVEEGLIFTGTNGYRINKLVSVKELIEELVNEYNEAIGDRINDRMEVA
ncbi:MAG: nitronate monooxygenase family protein [Erysipelotrichaceae bacterium]